jgi:hypothetical protein
MPIDPSRLTKPLSLQDVANLLGCDIAYLQRAQKDGYLIVTGTGSGELVYPSDLAAFLVRRHLARQTIEPASSS